MRLARYAMMVLCTASLCGCSSVRFSTPVEITSTPPGAQIWTVPNTAPVGAVSPTTTQPMPANLPSQTRTVAKDALIAVVPNNPGVGIALLVGVNDYEQMGKLDKCRQDAAEMREALVGRGGYSHDRVVLLTDDAKGIENRPSFAHLSRRIEQVCKLARPEDILIIFFAGHGITEGGKSYLVPLDGGEVMTCIQLDWIQDKMQGSAAKYKMLIVDACHSGKTTRGTSGIVPSLNADSGCVMISSCAENELSYPEGKHGVFTQYMLDGIKGAADVDENGQITSRELFRFVQQRMDTWCLKTGKTQRPQMLPPNAKDADVARSRKQ